MKTLITIKNIILTIFILSTPIIATCLSGCGNPVDSLNWVRYAYPDSVVQIIPQYPNLYAIRKSDGSVYVVNAYYGTSFATPESAKDKILKDAVMIFPPTK